MVANYTVLNACVNIKAVFPNAVPVDGCLGAGRPEATYSIERVIDMTAHELEIDPETIEIMHGDTAKIPFGMGTYGSRSLVVCGSAVVRTTEKIIVRSRKIAAHILETSDADIELFDGQFTPAFTKKSVSFGEVALRTDIPHQYLMKEIELGLEGMTFYDPASSTYPSGAYACEVDVDPEIGKVIFDRFTEVGDFGNTINPVIVTGQMHGGVGQGIGQALIEQTRYNCDMIATANFASRPI